MASEFRLKRHLPPCYSSEDQKFLRCAFCPHFVPTVSHRFSSAAVDIFPPHSLLLQHVVRGHSWPHSPGNGMILFSVTCVHLCVCVCSTTIFLYVCPRSHSAELLYFVNGDTYAHTFCQLRKGRTPLPLPFCGREVLRSVCDALTLQLLITNVSICSATSSWKTPNPPKPAHQKVVLCDEQFSVG